MAGGTKLGTVMPTCEKLSYLYTVVSWFGLEAEHSLVVALNSADDGLVMSLA